jgi:ketosteroid isomerase-like protein
MLPFFHEDIEYLPVEERGIVHGHDALRRYFDRWMEPWDEFQVGPTEFRHSDDSVLNGVAMKGRGRGSGVETTKEYWQVWRFREGRAARWEEYDDRAEALGAVGLSD